MRSIRKDIYIGARFLNTAGQYAVVKEVLSARKVLIEWESDLKNQNYTTSHQLRVGNFKNPYAPSVWGVGYLGLGDYSRQDNLDAYIAWQGVYQRCFDSKLHQKFPSYANKIVSPDWHCFQDFVQWYNEETKYTENTKGWPIDKDVFRSNEYGPETSVVVPQRLNILILQTKTKRGEYPIGVNVRPETGRFRARCQIGTGSPKSLGDYETIEEAFNVYKTFKEAFIKKVAWEYKGIISDRALDAFMAYEIMITD